MEGGSLPQPGPAGLLAHTLSLPTQHDTPPNGAASQAGLCGSFWQGKGPQHSVWEPLLVCEPRRPRDAVAPGHPQCRGRSRLPGSKWASAWAWGRCFGREGWKVGSTSWFWQNNF